MRWLLAVVVIAQSAAAWAQDVRRPEKERVVAPLRELRVLRDPYDIASFYRQGGTPPPASRYQDEEGRITIDPKAISSFYRSDTGGDGGYRYWPRYRYRPSRRR